MPLSHVRAYYFVRCPQQTKQGNGETTAAPPPLIAVHAGKEQIIRAELF